MTVQLSDTQVAQLQAARSAIATVIRRNTTRWVDIELYGVVSALDGVLGGSQSEQNADPAAATSTGPAA